MDSRIVLGGVIAFLAAGYVFYGRFVSRVLGVDPNRPTPAVAKSDGVDFVPARNWFVLFGHHFSSICASGPIVGPVLAVAYWGWGPSLAWILLGGVLLGAVADFTSLVLAVRHDGRSIAETTGGVVSRRARILFSTFLLLALVLVLAIFSLLTAQTFVQAPEIVLPTWGVLPVAVLAGLFLYRGAAGPRKTVLVTVGGLAALAALMFLGDVVPLSLGDGLFGLPAATVWVLLLLGYCAVASIVPVQYLLQPRDYLSSYVLFLTIAAGIAGVAIAGPAMSAEPLHSLNPPEWPAAAAGPIWPMLCVVIACGAISGFHSVVSSGTTCKQLATEGHALRIGFGAMLLESLVAGLVLVAVGAGIDRATHVAMLSPGGGGPIRAFAAGYGALTETFFGAYGPVFATLALNFFMLTTLDTASRLGRYLLQELTGWKGRVAPTLVVLGATAGLAFSGATGKLWPAFGASNQLVGALALLVTSLWLLGRGRPVVYTLVPAILMLLTTLAALGLQLVGSVAGGDWLVAGIDLVLIVLALVVVVEAGRVLRARFGGRAPAAGTAAG